MEGHHPDVNVALDHRARVEEFRRTHRIGLLTLLFTDIVGSTQLKQDLEDQAAMVLIQTHHDLVLELPARVAEAEEIGTAGDSFFIVFSRPSDATQFALELQSRLRAADEVGGRRIADRIGIHVGEVIIDEGQIGGKPKDLYGLQVDMCARVMSLAEAGQTLLTRSVFDAARQVLRGETLRGIGSIEWLNHGPYSLKGVEEPVEVCEVGESALAPLKPPGDSERAHRHVTPGAEPVLGWRPAVGLAVPGTQSVLDERLGEGGFGEVWTARHQTLRERRVFKFCFRAERARSLRREITLFRVLHDPAGAHPNLVRIHDVFLEQPPYYLTMDYVDGRDLKAWCESQGGVARVLEQPAWSGEPPLMPRDPLRGAAAALGYESQDFEWRRMTRARGRPGLAEAVARMAGVADTQAELYAVGDPWPNFYGNSGRIPLVSAWEVVSGEPSVLPPGSFRDKIVSVGVSDGTPPFPGRGLVPAPCGCYLGRGDPTPQEPDVGPGSALSGRSRSTTPCWQPPWARRSLPQRHPRPRRRPRHPRRLRPPRQRALPPDLQATR